MNLLNGTSFGRLEGALKAAELRQGVVANNIANVDTPNFKRSEVLFEELLSQEMGGQTVLQGKRTNERHIPIGRTSGIVPTAQTQTDNLSEMNNNENNVDIDREMSLLAKNQLSYNFYIQQINHDVKMMKTAIEGR
ncbi:MULTISPECIES: flagellar basal body rod protein FlgB [Paenibacillus]|uniref:Flagellar basal body rod protein FlgB n=1 Tax=Paenibacillus glycanilyticus TaxID=126569 RepID=A0ABQ6NTA4_9BACL|nr:flagellar basal body rod protein FlgB [Paenibacillus glycanilyticus]MCK9858182.1 flagellar basal body rod protein FlgB [Paenibacillus sp. ATY16]GMK48039.1 flagellar basal body rod protein FlgB [Paenibacillus glycanilyticus]